MALRYVAATLVLAVAITYSLLFHFNDIPVEHEQFRPVAIDLTEDETAKAVEHFSQVLRYPTLANAHEPENHVSQPAPFQQLHEYLQRTYAEVYRQLEWERVGNYSLLLKWQGSNPALNPILAMSHMDVVPAPDDNPSKRWTHGPFSGTVADGYIWGRGALDVKVTMVQLLEAVTHLLERGHRPTRSIYLAFGHDEEVGGECGAKRIATLLASRGVELELVLDEGGAVLLDGIGSPQFSLVPGPVAVVGTSEKGTEWWEITVTGTGGHSSIPPTDGSSVASRISKVLATLDAYPSPTTLVSPTTDWLKDLGPAVRLAPLRWLLQNADNWLVNPVLGQLVAQGGRELAALARTTVAVVQVEADEGALNVVPQSGRIRINFRTLPGHDSSFIQEYLSMIVRRHAPYASFSKYLDGPAAAPVSSPRGPHFQLVKQVIYETLAPPQGLAAVAPFLVTGGTDSKHYTGLAPGRVFRFCPQWFNRTAGDYDLIHGVDERIAIPTFLRGIRFYVRMLQLSSADESAVEGGVLQGSSSVGPSSQV